jgi:hypothetical protein
MLPMGIPLLRPLGGRGAEETLTSEESVSIRGNQRYEIMQRLAARGSVPTTSRSVVLRNMVSPDEVRAVLSLCACVCMCVCVRVCVCVCV